MSGAVEVFPLDPGRRDDFLDFFEHSAFTDNPRWEGCYCQCYYEDHRVVVWHDLSAADNRRHACERIARGTMQGCLAYLDGKVVGWCSAAPRALVHALDPEPLDDADAVGVITCFVVAPERRGQGIARALLQGAMKMLRDLGLQWVEANPRADASTAAEHHCGPLQLFTAAGFRLHRADADGSVWVRKGLAPSLD